MQSREEFMPILEIRNYNNTHKQNHRERALSVWLVFIWSYTSSEDTHFNIGEWWVIIQEATGGCVCVLNERRGRVRWILLICGCTCVCVCVCKLYIKQKFNRDFIEGITYIMLMNYAKNCER